MMMGAGRKRNPPAVTARKTGAAHLVGDKSTLKRPNVPKTLKSVAQSEQDSVFLTVNRVMRRRCFKDHSGKADDV